MYPHLAMLNNNRASSYQHRINFLKVNQLGFLHSKGFIKKNTIINTFLDKLLQLNKNRKYKLYKTVIKINNITEFIKSYNKIHKKGYVKKHLTEDIIKLKIRNSKLFFAVNFLRLDNFDYYMNYFSISSAAEIFNFNIVKSQFSLLFGRGQKNKKLIKKKIMMKLIDILLNKITIINKLNKTRKKMFNYLKKNIKKRNIQAKKRIETVYNYNLKKYGKTRAKNNKFISFLLIYLFLINKKTALINFKLYFKIEKLMRKSLIKGVQKNMIRTFGKNTLKALGVKNDKRKWYNKMLVFAEKNYIAHTPNILLKHLLFLKWKRQLKYNNFELGKSDYLVKNIFKHRLIADAADEVDAADVSNDVNNLGETETYQGDIKIGNGLVSNEDNKKIKQVKSLSLFERELLKKKKNKHHYHGIYIYYTSVFKKIKSSKDRNKNRLLNIKKNKNRKFNKKKKELNKKIELRLHNEKLKTKSRREGLKINEKTSSGPVGNQRALANKNNYMLNGVPQDILAYYEKKLSNISNKSDLYS